MNIDYGLSNGGGGQGFDQLQAYQEYASQVSRP